jgi:hypothetical protein
MYDASEYMCTYRAIGSCNTLWAHIRIAEYFRQILKATNEQAMLVLRLINGTVKTETIIHSAT